ncbi:LOW QUALITY PROTEIN: cilia- and flagella-associated protein 74 [Ctenodactylus gundi]
MESKAPVDSRDLHGQQGLVWTAASFSVDRKAPVHRLPQKDDSKASVDTTISVDSRALHGPRETRGSTLPGCWGAGDTGGKLGRELARRHTVAGLLAQGAATIFVWMPGIPSQGQESRYHIPVRDDGRIQNRPHSYGRPPRAPAVVLVAWHPGVRPGGTTSQGARSVPGRAPPQPGPFPRDVGRPRRVLGSQPAAPWPCARRPGCRRAARACACAPGPLLWRRARFAGRRRRGRARGSRDLRSPSDWSPRWVRRVRRGPGGEAGWGDGPHAGPAATEQAGRLRRAGGGAGWPPEPPGPPGAPPWPPGAPRATRSPSLATRSPPGHPEPPGPPGAPRATLSPSLATRSPSLATRSPPGHPEPPGPPGAPRATLSPSLVTRGHPEPPGPPGAPPWSPRAPPGHPEPLPGHPEPPRATRSPSLATRSPPPRPPAQRGLAALLPWRTSPCQRPQPLPRPQGPGVCKGHPSIAGHPHLLLPGLPRSPLLCASVPACKPRAFAASREGQVILVVLRGTASMWGFPQNGPKGQCPETEPGGQEGNRKGLSSEHLSPAHCAKPCGPEESREHVAFWWPVSSLEDTEAGGRPLALDEREQQLRLRCVPQDRCCEEREGAAVFNFARECPVLPEPGPDFHWCVALLLLHTCPGIEVQAGETAAVVFFVSSSEKEEGMENEKTEGTAATDRAQACHLRQHVGLLDQELEDMDTFLQKMRDYHPNFCLREELGTCRQRMAVLSQQQESLAVEIAEESEAGNKAAVGRLQAISRRLCTELEDERELQSKITAQLKKNEQTMWHLDVQKGQFESVQQCSREEAEAQEWCMRARAAQQLGREQAASRKATRSQLHRLRKSLYMQQELGLRHQKLVEDAQKNHRVAVKFLKASLGRLRKRQQQEELESRKQLRRRMDAVLALKSSIAANRETLQRLGAWSRSQAKQAERSAQAEQQAVLAQGGDAFRHLFHQRRNQELRAQQRAFEELQGARKQEIVDRILKEVAKEEKHRKQLQQTHKAVTRQRLRDKTWSYVSNFCESQLAPADTGLLLHVLLQPPAPQDSKAHGRSPALQAAFSSESIQSFPGATSAEEETLAEPEIPGMWTEDHKSYQVPKEDVDRKPVGGTKMDKDILSRTLEQLRCGLVHRQVASGREYKGRPFKSKPELIHFKDFDVGKVYKKRLTLTNATYTINYCRLVGVEEHLRDFIHVHFDPPGPMSAGMSCEVLVTFKPMINKDLEGNVSFVAQTGKFSVPLKCSTKKCSLSLDKDHISFGSYVVGETTSRTITLTNVGGLGTRFKIVLAPESCSVEESQSVLKLSSLFTSDDKTDHEKATSISISEQRLEGHDSSLNTPNQEGEKLSKPEGDPTASSMALLPSEEQAEITLGKVTEGDINPFSSIKVPVIFTPITPGEVKSRFKIMFKNPQCPALYFRATGIATDVPVWVPQPNVDLKICMYDRLYQDAILVRTRSKAALRLRFEVCKELKGHMELLPETGYIQALSSCSVQLKFLPQHSLPEDAKKYFDKDSRVLEAPVTIWVADQTKPVGFTVHAIVTTSDLEISPPEVDFGHCTIYEAVRTRVTLHNHSLLPQEFGFVGLPKFVDVQPNDGFGTILPLETLELDVIFQPTKAKEYSFELVCKSDINRCFKMSCRAVGVHPPLELSHYQIKFAATALYDTSVATLYVVNSHVSTNSLTHSVPRVGSGDPSPVGPTSFEFLPPPCAPVTISPAVGTVWPGKRCLVQVAFQPMLPPELTRQETPQTLAEDTEAKPFQKDTAAPEREARRQISVNPHRLPWASTRQAPELQKQDLQAGAEEHLAVQATLARAFQGKFDKFVVPCVVASGDVKDRKGLEPLSFSPYNTLYLELWCPAVAPSLVVTSDKGRRVINFGDVAVGHHNTKKVSVLNTSPEDLAVKMSVLSPSGPFILQNPPSQLRSGETQVLVLTFSPYESIQAQETLEVMTKHGTLPLTLTGTGVASVITCSIDGDTLDMGYVLAGESVSSSFKLQNESLLPVKFSVRLDSLSSARAEARQQLPRFLASCAQRTEVVGTQNYNGQSVFSVVPVKGTMDPGCAQSFTVTFSPDHESLYFSDRLLVVLFEKKISHQILLKGAARDHVMFVEGGDPLDVPVESLTVIPALDLEHREEAEELRPILVTLDCIQFDPYSPAPPATRELQVGCIRSTQQPLKKVSPLAASQPFPPGQPQSCPPRAYPEFPCSRAWGEHCGPPIPMPSWGAGPSLMTSPQALEFSLDCAGWLQQKGFSVEPCRGSVDRGQTKTISISWVPPSDFDPDQPLVVSTLLQLRGDVKETYKVIFVARVVTSL